MHLTQPENTDPEYGYKLVEWLLAKKRYAEAMPYNFHIMRALERKHGRSNPKLCKYLLLFARVEAKLEFWDASEALLSRAMHIFHTEQPKDAESRQLLIDCTEFYSDEIIAKDKARQKQEDEQEERILNGGVGNKKHTRPVMPPSKIIALQEQVWWRSELEATPCREVLQVLNEPLPEMSPPKCTMLKIVTNFHPDLLPQVMEVLEEHGLRVNQLEVHVKRDRERNNAMWYVCNFYVFLDYTRDKLSEQRMVELARSVQELLPEPMTKEEQMEVDREEAQALAAQGGRAEHRPPQFPMLSGKCAPFLGSLHQDVLGSLAGAQHRACRMSQSSVATDTTRNHRGSVGSAWPSEKTGLPTRQPRMSCMPGGASPSMGKGIEAGGDDMATSLPAHKMGLFSENRSKRWSSTSRNALPRPLPAPNGRSAATEGEKPKVNISNDSEAWYQKLYKAFTEVKITARDRRSALKDLFWCCREHGLAVEMIQCAVSSHSQMELIMHVYDVKHHSNTTSKQVAPEEFAVIKHMLQFAIAEEAQSESWDPKSADALLGVINARKDTGGNFQSKGHLLTEREVLQGADRDLGMHLLMANVPEFRALPSDRDREAMLDLMTCRRVKQGSIIVGQYMSATHFGFVTEGDLLQHQMDGFAEMLPKGTCFGVMGLSFETEMSMTVEALTDVTTYTLSWRMFQFMYKVLGVFERMAYTEALKQAAAFARIIPPRLQVLSDACWDAEAELKLSRGRSLIKASEKLEKMYFVLSGGLVCKSVGGSRTVCDKLVLGLESMEKKDGTEMKKVLNETVEASCASRILVMSPDILVKARIHCSEIGPNGVFDLLLRCDGKGFGRHGQRKSMFGVESVAKEWKRRSFKKSGVPLLELDSPKSREEHVVQQPAPRKPRQSAPLLGFMHKKPLCGNQVDLLAERHQPRVSKVVEAYESEDDDDNPFEVPSGSVNGSIVGVSSRKSSIQENINEFESDQHDSSRELEAEAYPPTSLIGGEFGRHESLNSSIARRYQDSSRDYKDEAVKPCEPKNVPLVRSLDTQVSSPRMFPGTKIEPPRSQRVSVTKDELRLENIPYACCSGFGKKGLPSPKRTVNPAQSRAEAPTALPPSIQRGLVEIRYPARVPDHQGSTPVRYHTPGHAPKASDFHRGFPLNFVCKTQNSASPHSVLPLAPLEPTHVRASVFDNDHPQAANVAGDVRRRESPPLDSIQVRASSQDQSSTCTTFQDSRSGRLRTSTSAQALKIVMHSSLDSNGHHGEGSVKNSNGYPQQHQLRRHELPLKPSVNETCNKRAENTPMSSREQFRQPRSKSPLKPSHSRFMSTDKHMSLPKISTRNSSHESSHRNQDGMTSTANRARLVRTHHSSHESSSEPGQATKWSYTSSMYSKVPKGPKRPTHAERKQEIRMLMERYKDLKFVTVNMGMQHPMFPQQQSLVRGDVSNK
mmetsp:Transcript_26068/g.49509  ORF Transcript_26068/g.49509 Transcript_26068/m.49509 type:complete len:1436 (-) Transcript_26068:327-4634(-)